MKNFKLLIFIVMLSVVNSSAFSQMPIAAIELPELNVLYRGYANKIIPAVYNNGDGIMFLTGENVSISKKENEDYFIVKPTNRQRCVTIGVNLINGDDTTLIRNIDYRVSNLPYPELYWGVTKQGQKANIRENKIFVKYPPEIPLNASFNIVKWEIAVDTNVLNAPPIMGKGSNISEAESLLKKVTQKSNISIIVTFVGPDGIQRKTDAIWKVDAWDESEEPTNLIQSGG